MATDTVLLVTSSTKGTKVQENRLRRMADRQGLRLEKSRRRDHRALDFGTYTLTDIRKDEVVVVTTDLKEVEAVLTGAA